MLPTYAPGVSPALFPRRDGGPRRSLVLRHPGSRAARWRRVRLRRVVTGLCASVACWLALGPYGVRGGTPTAPTLVSAADLPLGHVLRPGDVSVRDLPREAVPAAALRDPTQAVGRPLAVTITEGEILTTVRVRAGGPHLAPGSRAVHIPLQVASAADRLAAGDHVDLVAISDGALVAADAVVVEVDKATAGAFGAVESGRGLTVAVPTDRAGPLTSAALGGRGGVHVVLRPN